MLLSEAVEQLLWARVGQDLVLFADRFEVGGIQRAPDLRRACTQCQAKQLGDKKRNKKRGRLAL